MHKGGCVHTMTKVDSSDALKLETMGSVWKNRKLSNLVKWFLLKGTMSREEVAEMLGTTTAYFNNKMHRDSFSFEDLVKIGNACGFDFIIASNRDIDLRVIDAKYFSEEEVTDAT